MTLIAWWAGTVLLWPFLLPMVVVGGTVSWLKAWLPTVPAKVRRLIAKLRREPARDKDHELEGGLPAPRQNGIPAPQQNGVPAPQLNGIPAPMENDASMPQQNGSLGPTVNGLPI